MDKLRLSLVVPAYNEEKYLGGCLKSALANSAGNFFEIIVVNNNSTDGTQAVAETTPGVKVVLETKQGLTSARQGGYRAATGDILAYVDADSLPPAGWAARVIREFSADPNLALLSGPYYYYDIPWWQKFLVRAWYFAALPVYWSTGYMATGGNFAIRKSVLDKMGGFDENIEFYGEDTDIARRAHRFGQVKFSLTFVMPTSGRRFSGQGYFKTAYTYFINFFSEVVFKKPATKEHKDIR